MTPEEVRIWVDEVDELGSSLFAGKELTREEFLELGDYYLSGKYLQDDLIVVRKRKEEAQTGLKALEAAEESILQRMKKHNIKPKMD